jgi:hypothetical protein
MKTREIHNAQFVLIAKPMENFVQVSLMDISDVNPLMWSYSMTEEDATATVKAFEKYGYTTKFIEFMKG